MEKHYIELGGRRFRAEYNWNALTSFLVATGQDTMEGMSDLKMRPSEIAKMIFFAVREGERLDGRELDITEEWIGENLDTQKVVEIFSIFNAHTSNGAKAEPGESKKKSLFRRSGKSGGSD